MSNNEISCQIISGNTMIEIPRNLIPEIPVGTPNDEVVDIIITALERYVAEQGKQTNEIRKG